MKSLKVLFILLTIFMTFVLTIASLPLEEVEEDYNANNEITQDYQESSDDDSQNGLIVGRLLAQKKIKTKRLKCNKFPRICRAKGSPGPYCCKKKCVNVLTDRLNCGACGKKCKYNEICCNGKCVNPSFNKRHCGGCNNRCNTGGFCVFGLCNYA